MNEREDRTLDLDDVVRGFSEAESSLLQVRERLQSLTDANDRAEAELKSLDEAASSLRAFAEAAQEATQQLSETHRLSQDALQRAATVLDGSEIRQLETLLSQVDQQIKASEGRFEERLNGLDQQVKIVVEALQEQHQTLDAQIKQGNDEVRESLTSMGVSQDELGEKLDVQNAMLEELSKRRKRFLLF